MKAIIQLQATAELPPVKVQDQDYSRSKSENLCARRKQNSGLTLLGIPTLQTLIMRYMVRLRYYCGSRVDTDCSLKPFNSVTITNHGVIVRKIPILPPP